MYEEEDNIVEGKTEFKIDGNGRKIWLSIHINGGNHNKFVGILRSDDVIGFK